MIKKKILLILIILSFYLAIQSSHSEEPKVPHKKGKMSVSSFDFNNVDIKEVIKAISKITGNNFIFDDKIRGNVTIIGPREVTVDEAYKAFLSSLEILGYTTLHEGKIIKIIRSNEARQEPLSADSDPYVTRILPIQYINPQEISEVLKNLISNDAHLIVYNPTNSIIITERKDNINKLLKVIEKLDVAGSQEKLEVIPIRHASATEIADKLKAILSAKGKGSQDRKKAVSSGEEQLELQSAEIIPYERTNSLIVLATDAAINVAKNLIAKLDVALDTEISGGKFHVHRLEHADAEALSETLQALAAGSSAKKGQKDRPQIPRPPDEKQYAEFEGEVKIVADGSSNSLIITSSPSDYKTLVQMINQLDIRRKQVFVEALILEVTMGKGFKMGGITGNGAIGDKLTSFGTLFGSTFGGFNSGISDPLTLTGMSLGFFSKDTATLDVPGGQDVTVPVIGAILALAGSSNNINVLSTPHVLTTDNEEAEITVGSNVPFVSGSGRDSNMNPVIQVSRQDVAITLKVTPQISSANYVTLKVEQNVEEIIPGQDSSVLTSVGPSTTTRKAKTVVVVKDQQTVVIGGLMGDKQVKSISKVPILGDIPLLGWFFRKTQNTTEKTNLLLFLTPYVIDDTSDMDSVFFRKVQQRQKFLKDNSLKEKRNIKDFGLDLDLKPLPKIDPSERPEIPEKPVEKVENKIEKKDDKSLIEHEVGKKEEIAIEQKSESKSDVEIKEEEIKEEEKK